jgi:hypothetical protein
MGLTELSTVELVVSDYSQISSLADYLRLTAPGVTVSRDPGRADQGELGVVDILTVAADSGVLIAVVNSLPAYLRSRKPGISVTVKTKGGKQLTVTASSAEDVVPILDRFLDD